LAEKLQLIGIFGFSVSSIARDASIGKHSAEEVKVSALLETETVNDQPEDLPAEIAHPTQDRPILSRLPTGSDLR